MESPYKKKSKIKHKHRPFYKKIIEHMQTDNQPMEIDYPIQTDNQPMEID